MPGNKNFDEPLYRDENLLKDTYNVQQEKKEKLEEEEEDEEPEVGIDIRAEQEAAGSYDAPEVVSVDLADVVDIRNEDQVQAAESYDAPQPAAESYDAPKPAAESYDAPQPAAESYDAPQAAANDYSAPQNAPESYEAPQAAANDYSAPQNAPESYEAPQAAGDNYNAPQAAPENYGAPDANLDNYDNELSSYGNRIQSASGAEVVDLTGYKSQSAQGAYTGPDAIDLRRPSRSNLRLRPLVVDWNSNLGSTPTIVWRSQSHIFSCHIFLLFIEVSHEANTKTILKLFVLITNPTYYFLLKVLDTKVLSLFGLVPKMYLFFNFTLLQQFCFKLLFCFYFICILLCFKLVNIPFNDIMQISNGKIYR